MPLIGGPLIANGDSGPLLTEDLITDTSKKITNTDYYDVVIQGLKVNKQYVSQFRWQYEDGTFGEWSNNYEFTTDDELDPDTPSTPILVTGVGFFTVRWNGNNSTGQALTDFSQINVYVSGGSFNASLPAATLTQAGTANIAAAIGSYSVTFKALRSSGKISDSSTAASVSITTDSADASTALIAANQAQLAAGVAQSTANGKNKVTYSTSPPESTANTAGDIWYQYGTSGPNNGRIIAQYSGAGGTSWTQTTISGLVVANLDAGTITSGIINVGIGITGTNGSFTLDAITGALTATSANITGTVTATSGRIGKLGIASNQTWLYPTVSTDDIRLVNYDQTIGIQLRATNTFILWGSDVRLYQSNSSSRHGLRNITIQSSTTMPSSYQHQYDTITGNLQTYSYVDGDVVLVYDPAS